MTAAPVVVLVTDPAYALAHLVGVVRAAGAALPPGALSVQLRDKRGDAAAFEAAALALRDAARSVGAGFVVNAGSRTARALASGVHVPGRGSVAEARAALGPGAFVSAAAHDDDDVRRAVREGASAVLVSPVFDTPGKGPARGVAALTSARALADAAGGRTRVIALGGVEPSRAASCAAAGAHGVAVIRALLDAPDPGAAARALAAPFAAVER